GAFGTQKAHLLPMHVWEDADPVFIGVASIYESGNEAIADIEINMKLARGREWYEALKFAQDHGQTIEWSYGFKVDDSETKVENGSSFRLLKKLTVYEVSPVVLGAGEGTRMLSLKKHKDGDKKAYVQLQGSYEQTQLQLYTALQ